MYLGASAVKIVLVDHAQRVIAKGESAVEDGLAAFPVLL
ncbi:hypothetical protein ABIB06_000809 [Bradyrhizobium sp. LB8.2]